MSDFNSALMTHWAVTRLGMAILVASAVPVVAFLLAVLTQTPEWYGLAAFGPMVAGLYLATVKIPEPVPDVDD